MVRRAMLGGLMLVCLGCGSPASRGPATEPVAGGVPGSATPAVGASPRREGVLSQRNPEGTLRRARELTRQGSFEEADRMLREELAHGESESLRFALSGNLLEAGRPEEALREIGPLLERSPKDLKVLETAARAALFAESLKPEPRPEAVEEIRGWLAEISRQHRAGGRIGPGSASLPLQFALLTRQYAEAGRMAEMLRRDPALDAYEVPDVLFLQADLALRAGERERARELLDEYLARTGKERSGDYVELYPVRFLAMWVAHAYVGRPLDPGELREYEARLRQLQEQDLRVKFPARATAAALERYAAARTAAERRQALLAFAETFPPERENLCFFGEVVQLPVARAALALRLGDLARETGDPRAARGHYEQGLRLHPEDRIVQARLQELEAR